MKVNNTIKAILMAALAAISYTIPQAQADTGAQMQTALNSIKSDYTDVYALTFTVTSYQGVNSGGSNTGCTLLELRSASSSGDNGYYLITTDFNCSSIYLSSDDNKPRFYNSDTQHADERIGGTYSGDVNTYTDTPSNRDYKLYGIFSQGKGLTGTAPLAGATYTVAYDGTNSTIVMKSTDGTINKAILKNTKLDLQAFSFYSTDKGETTFSTITNGSLTSLTDVYTWNGSDALTWDSHSWSLSLADGQSFKSGSDVAFNNEDANTVQADSVTAGNVAVNVDQTIVVAGDNVTFVSTTVGDGKTLTLKSSGGTIDLGEVSMGKGARLVVDASSDPLVLLNESAELEVAIMTIDSGYHVDFYTGNPQVEGTVTITESLTAGGAELYANLILDGATLNVNGGGDNALTLGSQFGIAEGTLVTLDANTLTALDALSLDESLTLIKNVDTLTYDKVYDGMWFGQLFERPDTLVGDFKVVADGDSFGLVKVSNVPEPTTGTLSLLALCALAARRRKH